MKHETRKVEVGLLVVIGLLHRVFSTIQKGQTGLIDPFVCFDFHVLLSPLILNVLVALHSGPLRALVVL